MTIRHEHIERETILGPSIIYWLVVGFFGITYWALDELSTAIYVVLMAGGAWTTLYCYFKAREILSSQWCMADKTWIKAIDVEIFTSLAAWVLVSGIGCLVIHEPMHLLQICQIICGNTLAALVGFSAVYAWAE